MRVVSRPAPAKTPARERRNRARRRSFQLCCSRFDSRRPVIDLAPVRPLLLTLLVFAALGCGPQPAEQPLDAGDPPCGACQQPQLDAGHDGGSPDAGSEDGGQGDGGGPSDFVELPVHVPVGPLCHIPAGWVPDGGLEATYLTCGLASDRFTDRDPAIAPSKLEVVAWNIEFGKEHATVLSELLTRAELKDADVLLLSEVSRDSLSSEPARVDQARELARALKMNYLFAVEWDWREHPDRLGEHGVAILSKYPIGNATQLRHVPQRDWWTEDRQYGGRITLGADLWVAGRRVRVYSSHLCTRGGETGRAAQAAEIRADAQLAGRASLQIVGGDLNTYLCNPTLGTDCTKPPSAEQAIEDFLADGWLDGTEGFNGHTQLGAGLLLQRLDWIFYRGGTSTPGAAVTSAQGSDHFPVYSSIGF